MRRLARISCHINRTATPSRHYSKVEIQIPCRFIPTLDKGDMSAVEQLKQHFSQLPPHKQASGWEAMWEKKVTPWDRSAPNPALVDILEDKTDILGLGTSSKRKRALIPGCGRGYDVLLFASHGYNAWGLDTAPSAIEAGEELKRHTRHGSSQYPVQNEDLGAGVSSFLLANFFEDDFLAQTNGSKFDVIYDYTFLCALHPEMRPLWAKRMSDLLADNGILICLEFPLSKPPSSGGPPHGLSSNLYVELFKSPGDEIAYDDTGHVATNSERDVSVRSLSRIAHWKPARTHTVGQSTDMVSIWQHRSWVYRTR